MLLDNQQAKLNVKFFTTLSLVKLDVVIISDN
jgi:hypothetical protein